MCKLWNSALAIIRITTTTTKMKTMKNICSSNSSKVVPQSQLKLSLWLLRSNTKYFPMVRGCCFWWQKWSTMVKADRWVQKITQGEKNWGKISSCKKRTFLFSSPNERNIKVWCMQIKKNKTKTKKPLEPFERSFADQQKWLVVKRAKDLPSYKKARTVKKVKKAVKVKCTGCDKSFGRQQAQLFFVLL